MTAALDKRVMECLSGVRKVGRSTEKQSVPSKAWLPATSAGVYCKRSLNRLERHSEDRSLKSAKSHT